MMTFTKLHESYIYVSYESNLQNREPNGMSYFALTPIALRTLGLCCFVLRKIHCDNKLLSPQELVKELVGCKEKLVSTEERLATADEQLKELKSYMDTLLLRIMETNPSILSANP